MGSNILAPGLHYIGAPSIKKTCFFSFLTRIKMNLVQLVEPYVTHKTWFPSRISKINFWVSNILEPGSNILEPPYLPDCLSDKFCDRFGESPNMAKTNSSNFVHNVNTIKQFNPIDSPDTLEHFQICPELS